MNLYRQEPVYDHGSLPKVGVLLSNLGTPDEPTAPALRRYLRQFLSDPRVVEEPRWKWLPILYLFVLTTRPAKSAALYREIWTPEGSPLLVICRRLEAAIRERLAAEVASPLEVALGMRYGQPSIAGALQQLREKGCRRLLHLSLYPQYSASTSGSNFDAVAAELTRWRFVPELRTVQEYHDDPAYIAALAASIRERWQADGEPEKILFSYHGIPLRYFLAGDPYHCVCHKTTRLVAEALGLDRSRYETAFQSIFGREEWIKPTTDVTVRAMAKAGVKTLDVVCPGFSADCLETLEEIDGQNRHLFEGAGGERFRYVPCLNDRPDHVTALTALIRRNLEGWVATPGEWDAHAAEAAAEASRQRAEDLRRRGAPADAGYGGG